MSSARSSSDNTLNADQLAVTPTSPPNSRTGQLLEVFQRLQINAQQTSSNHWQLRSPACRRPITCAMDRQWLTLSLPLRALSGPVNDRALRTMLSRNASMRGSPRLIADGIDSKRHVIIELPIEHLPWRDLDDLATCLAGALFELIGAMGLEAAAARPPVDASAPSLAALARTLADKGRESRIQDETYLEVPLNISGHYITARIECGDTGIELLTSMPLTDTDPRSGICCEAVRLLLWLTASSLRLVKPLYLNKVPSFAIALPHRLAETAFLDTACAGLAHAATEFLPPASALTSDRKLALTYLSTMRFPGAADPDRQTISPTKLPHSR